jgi:hypothetical protein
MLLSSARTVLFAALLLACADTSASSASSGVVVAPVAPPPRVSAPTVDPSTVPTSGDASTSGGASDAGSLVPSGVPSGIRFRACNTDADCVAVPRVGCCHNGWNEAVAASQRDAYAASFTCPDAHPICAMIIVRDARVPQCDGATHLCTLIAK